MEWGCLRVVNSFNSHPYSIHIHACGPLCVCLLCVTVQASDYARTIFALGVAATNVLGLWAWHRASPEALRQWYLAAARWTGKVRMHAIRYLQ